MSMIIRLAGMISIITIHSHIMRADDVFQLISFGIAHFLWWRFCDKVRIYGFK